MLISYLNPSFLTMLTGSMSLAIQQQLDYDYDKLLFSVKTWTYEFCQNPIDHVSYFYQGKVIFRYIPLSFYHPGPVLRNVEFELPGVWYRELDVLCFDMPFEI